MTLTVIQESLRVKVDVFFVSCFSILLIVTGFLVFSGKTQKEIGMDFEIVKLVFILKCYQRMCSYLKKLEICLLNNFAPFSFSLCSIF